MLLLFIEGKRRN